MSIEEVRQSARRLERRVARRNRREYIAAVVVVCAFGWVLWHGPAAVDRIGAGLVIAATLFVCYWLHVQGAAASLPAGLGTQSSLEFLRGQLERQRDLLRSVWLWYILPFAPGLFVPLIGAALTHPERVWRAVAFGVFLLIFGFGVHVLNRRAAARIQRRLDGLKDYI